VAGSWDGDPKADPGSAGRQPAVAGSVPATMISLTDLVSEAFRPAARNTDLAVYVPNLVYRADL